MEKVFNFGQLNDDHKAAAQEILRVCRNLGYEEMVDNIQSRFELEDIPVYEIGDDHPLLVKLNSLGMSYSIQGYTRDNGIDYPYITLCEDIRKFEDLIK